MNDMTAAKTVKTQPASPLRYRTIWISDIHLGTHGCKAEALLDFLKSTESENLYLVGDIIDVWRLKKKFYWPQAHNDVIQKLLRKARKGTRVIYVPGNHDEAARGYTDLNFGDIEIVHEAFHETADGKTLWVVHGDLFDGVMQYAKWLAHFGDVSYTMLLAVNNTLNRWRFFFNKPYWSLSKYLKHKVKNAVSFMTAFENVMIQETRRKKCDGVVCGHIHKAELREVNGIIYANDGDWVESLTALVEHFDGRLEILQWHYDPRLFVMKPKPSSQPVQEPA